MHASGQPASDRSTVTLGIVQMSCVEQPRDNLEAAIGWIERAAAEGVQVVCLQELFASRYFCQAEDHRFFELAESIPGPASERLGEAARRLGVVIVAGLFERRAPGLFHNSAVVIDSDGRLAGIYRKMHIPDDPFYYEKFYFTPGDLGFRTFDTAVARIGVCICWDQWFPEAARLTALSGAHILVYPTAIGWLAEDKGAYGNAQLDAWRTMMRSHAIANGVFVAAPNRVGVEENIEFWGHSFVSDPYGNVIAQAGGDGPQLLVVPCPLASIETARTHWPFLRDRRIDAYRPLTQRMIDAPATA